MRARKKPRVVDYSLACTTKSDGSKSMRAGENKRETWTTKKVKKASMDAVAHCRLIVLSFFSVSTFSRTSLHRRSSFEYWHRYNALYRPVITQSAGFKATARRSFFHPSHSHPFARVPRRVSRRPRLQRRLSSTG